MHCFLYWLHACARVHYGDCLDLIVPINYRYIATLKQDAQILPIPSLMLTGCCWTCGYLSHCCSFISHCSWSICLMSCLICCLTLFKTPGTVGRLWRPCSLFSWTSCWIKTAGMAGRLWRPCSLFSWTSCWMKTPGMVGRLWRPCSSFSWTSCWISGFKAAIKTSGRNNFIWLTCAYNSQAAVRLTNDESWEEPRNGHHHHCQPQQSYK